MRLELKILVQTVPIIIVGPVLLRLVESMPGPVLLPLVDPVPPIIVEMV